MFVGRKDEMAALERLYAKRGFQMMVVYGRRRVGKTTLVDRFAAGKGALHFTAQVQSGPANLRDFSRCAYEHFGVPAGAGPFQTWLDAFAFVARQPAPPGRRPVLVFDEFPYAAASSPEMASALQLAIDRDFAQAGAMVVLCGSNEGFMESEVLGHKSPLYGRRTGQLRLLPFDCFDAALMLPQAGSEDVVRYYATFGGTPYYLAQVDPGKSYRDNVAELFFDKSGLLYEEPMMLLRQELREPANYNSVLSAVAHGATTPKRIAERAGVEEGSCAKYLKTLEGLSIVRREVPFGDNPARSRKGAWRMADPFFAYWYRFVGPNVGAVEAGVGAEAASRAAIGDPLDAFVGKAFEDVCLQWLVRRNRAGELPFLASRFGRWWGTDPEAREQADVDAIAAEAGRGRALVAECKWRNAFDESEAVGALERRAALVPGVSGCSFLMFTKRPLHAATLAKLSARGDFEAVTIAEALAGARG